MKKITILILFSTLLMSCTKTQYTYVLQHPATNDVMLFTTTSKDTVQMIDNCKQYLSLVPYSVDKNGIVEITHFQYVTNENGDRTITHYMDDESVIWFESVAKIEQEPSYKNLTIAFAVLVVIGCFMVYGLINALPRFSR